MKDHFSPVSKFQLLKTVLMIVISFLFTNQLNAQKLNLDKLEGLTPRSIGPAGMSGRVTSIDVVNSNPEIIYIGTASGGLWKSVNGGTSFEPIFDDQPVASIGAVAVDQRIPDIIWAGTGEGNPRNSQASGNGIYKSLDGGKHWIHLGLENTRNIHRVIIDPYNSDIVYVAAQGSAWGEHPERGIYKTTDGGETWNKILYINEKTGAADLVMDPKNPYKLIAAMWQFRRYPWFFNSGGEGSGLYVTFDGGKTWKERTDKDGLPKGELGRIGLAIAPSEPDIIYALVESKKNALYKSTDGGFKWKKINDKDEIGNRPFYYADIYVDPENENRVYSLYSGVNFSEDGGKSFERLIGWSEVHPDHHAWWIHPDDPEFLIDGNDGGLAISRDKGKTWRFVQNLPLAQFYHINVDDQFPYKIYGGMQDNGSWYGPSRVRHSGGILNSYWQMISFGDGFDVVPDRSNNRYCYSMSQGGNLYRTDLETGYRKTIQPVHPEGKELRFNWNAGIASDPLNPETIYFGSQFLHKSTNRGDSWEIISPDLTTNDPEKQKQLESGGLTYDVTDAENFTTIISISPSPVKDGVIWVGTDDGNLQLTTNGGKNWKNVVDNINGVPVGTWIPQVNASNYNEAEALVVFDDHRRNNWDTYVYHTTDYGESWTSVANNDSIFGYALAIYQDIYEPKLMFLGTEFGLYVTIDGGKNWNKWIKDFPTVSTMDFAYNKREDDLIAGTFGRAIYIFDDIQPLRELAKQNNKLLDKNLYMFEIPDAYMEYYQSSQGVLYPGVAEFSGENESNGAMITFIANKDTSKNKNEEEEDSLKTEEDKFDPSKIKFQVIDETGNVVRTFTEKFKPGLNRIYWRFETTGVRYPSQPKPKKDSDEPRGEDVLPGTYLVKAIYGDYVDSAYVNVNFDPRMDYNIANLKEVKELNQKFYDRVKVATEGADRLREAKEISELIKKRIDEKENDNWKDLKKETKEIQDSIKTLLEEISGKEVQGIYRNPNTVNSKIYNVRSYIGSTLQPDESINITMEQATKRINEFIEDVNNFFNSEWKEYMQKVKEAEVSLYEDYKPIEKIE